MCKARRGGFQDTKTTTNKIQEKGKTCQRRFPAARFERGGRVKNRCVILPQVRRRQPEKHLVARRSHSKCDLFHYDPKCHLRCHNFQRAEVPQRRIIRSSDIVFFLFLFVSLIIIFSFFLSSGPGPTGYDACTCLQQRREQLA